VLDNEIQPTLFPSIPSLQSVFETEIPVKPFVIKKLRPLWSKCVQKALKVVIVPGQIGTAESNWSGLESQDASSKSWKAIKANDSTYTKVAPIDG
jgi:hypothetical protein